MIKILILLIGFLCASVMPADRGMQHAGGEPQYFSEESHQFRDEPQPIGDEMLLFGGETYDALLYAEACFEEIGSGEQPDNVYVMEYTSRGELTDIVLGTEMYTDIPEWGYAILIHSYVSGDAFSESYACFLNSDGELEVFFDYEESEALFELHYGSFSPYDIESGELAVMYLENCNYISHMINYAGDYCEELGSEFEKNVWYSLNEDQIKRIW